MAKVKAELPLLAAHRRLLNLLGFYFYTWAGDEHTGAPSFNFAGLFDDVNGRLRAKPVYSVFRQGVLALERCRRTGATAGTCAQPTSLSAILARTMRPFSAALPAPACRP